MPVKPPKDISTQALFRLVTAPRPIIDIAHRVRGAEHLELSVRALSSRGWAESVENSRDQTGFYAEVVARALLADGSLAFRSPSEAKTLSEDHLVRLGNVVVSALDRLCPPRWRMDEGEWHAVLRKGALHASNSADGYALGTSFEIAGNVYLDRPERFYGIPVRDLTDGHWLAYRVCRKLIDEASRK